MSILARAMTSLGLRSAPAGRMSPRVEPDPFPSAKASTGKPKPNLRGKVVPDLSLWLQFQRIGGSLTPQQVSEIMRLADSGYMWRLMDLANDARQKDCHLHGVLAQSEEAIASLDWQLVLPDTAKAKAKKAARFVEDRLRKTARFRQQIGHMAGGVYYGYAVSETIWDKLDGKLVPKGFERIAPRRFGYRQEDGVFVWRDINSGDSITGHELADYPDKFIVSQPRVNGDVPAREGLVRVLMWAALFRNWTITDWLRTGEIAWKPWRIGKYKKDSASQEDIDNLVAILEGLSSNGVAALPDTTEYDIEWAPNSSTKSTHSELFNVVAQEMSKAVLGQTETVQASSSSGYAQARVHEAVAEKLLLSRANSVAEDLTRDLVEPMIRLNYGPDVEVPLFRFVTKKPADFKVFSTGVKLLVDAGLKIPQDWAREEAGIPNPDDDDEVLGGKSADEKTGDGDPPPEDGAGDEAPIDPATGLPKEPDAPDTGAGDG